MKTVILYDECGFDEDDFNFMNRHDFAEEVPARNIEMFMSIRSGSQPLPVLSFKTKEGENFFLDKIKKNTSIQAFTTMPQNELKYFNGCYFQDNEKTLRVSCALTSGDPDLCMYSGRLLKFTKETQTPLEVHPSSLIENNEDNKRDYQATGYHMAYLNPIILDLNEQKSLAFYTFFFKDRNKFPIALPTGKPVATESYFGQYNYNGSDFEKREIRRKIREVACSNENVRQTLLYALWSVVDQPVFTEYLKDGAYFSFHATSLSSKQLNGKFLPQDFDGQPVICFNYPSKKIPDNEFLQRWRADLIEIDSPDDSLNPVNKVKKAILGDVKFAFPGPYDAMMPVEKNLYTNWDFVPRGTFDIEMPRTNNGWWVKIEKINNCLKDKEKDDGGVLSDFITNMILNPSEKQGNNPHDHNLALQLFCDNICKFPFKIIPGPAGKYEGRKIRIFEEAWKKNCVDLISGEAALPWLTGEELIRNENGNFAYALPLTPEQIFSVRLLLRPDDYVESSFSSVLDFNNALDRNFIL